MRELPEGWRQCEYCGCKTNAKVRACCRRGYQADRPVPNPYRNADAGVYGTEHVGQPVKKL